METNPPPQDSTPRRFGRRLLATYEFCAWGGWWFVIVIIAFRPFLSVHPLFELSSHFTLHALAIACLGATIATIRFLFARRNLARIRSDQILKLTVFSAGILLLCLIIKPWQLIPQTSPPNNPNQVLRILSWNVWLDNWSAIEIRRVIESCDADIIALYELNPQVAQRIESVRDAYVSQDWNPEWSPGSIVALSRIPQVTFKRWQPADEGMPALEIQIPKGKLPQDSVILALHTKSPTPFFPGRTRARDRQLASVANWASSQSNPCAIMGDLNITPWSPAFSQTLQQGQLRDSRLGIGNQASWIAFLGPLGIPIDHVLINSQFRVVSRRILPGDFGSDHAPVLIEIEISNPSSK